LSLRRLILEHTGQDLRKCQACTNCNIDLPDEKEIQFATLIQMVLLNDEEALQTRIPWSDAVLEASRGACNQGLDLHAVMLVLRNELDRRTSNDAVHPDR